MYHLCKPTKLNDKLTGLIVNMLEDFVAPAVLSIYRYRVQSHHDAFNHGVKEVTVHNQF